MYFQFCHDLKNRPEWEGIPATLLALQQPRWKQSRLETHDISLPLPPLSGETTGSSALLLLMSAADLETARAAATWRRIERLSLLNGGDNVFILFLLKESSQESHARNGMHAFGKLQIDLLRNAYSITLCPFQDHKSLAAALSVLHRQLIKRRAPPNQAPSAEKQQEIVKTACSAKSKGLKDHTVNILCDLCHDFKELSEWSTTKDGTRAIAEYVQDENEISNAVGFWRQEYIAE